MARSSHLGEYFLVVGPGKDIVPIAGQTSTNPLDISFQGEVLDRYPQSSSSDCNAEFPPGIAMFCLPNGLRFSKDPEMPIFYSFASTVGSGERLYGACLKFYEKASNDIVLRAKQALADLHRSSATISKKVADWQSSSVSSSGADDDGDPDSDDAVSGKLSAVADSGENSRESVGDDDGDFSQFVPAHDTGKMLSMTDAVEDPTTMLTAAGNPSSSLNDDLRNNSNSYSSDDSNVQENEVFFDAEEGPDDTMAAEEKASNVEDFWFAPKCICILSSWPFFGPMRTFLTQLYRISLTPTPIPLERHLVNFMREVPVPPRGGVKVQFTIADQTICLSRPPVNDPLSDVVSGFDLIELFELLPVDKVVIILECLLLERKVVFLSSQYSLLMSIAESFLLLMYPFRWQHVYIPLLPEALLDFLNAPMPFLIGTHHSFIRSYAELPDSVIIVNLDAQSVAVPGNPPRLPEHERSKLISSLKSVVTYQNSLWGARSPLSASASANNSPTAARKQDGAVNEAFLSLAWTEADLAFTNAPPPDQVEMTSKHIRVGMDSKGIRSAFFRVFVSMLKNYRDFIVYPNEGDPFPNSFFRAEEFIATFPNSSHRFLADFLSTQAFAKFIEDRVVPGCEGTSSTPTASDPTNMHVDTNDADVLVFDESIIVKHNRSKFVKKKPTRFLDQDFSKDGTTFVAPSSEASDLPVSSFDYPVWPVPLKPELFNQPRLTTSLLRLDSVRRRDLQSKKGVSRATLWERKSSGSSLPILSSQQHIFAVWFSLLTVICSTKRQAKLLSSAFPVLERLRQAGIPADQQIFKDLIQCCGKCKCPEVALVFLEHMQRDGIVADAQIYSALFTAFSTNGDLSHAYHTLGTLGRVKKPLSPDSESLKAGLSNSWRREKQTAPTMFDEEECRQSFNAAFPGLQCVTKETCPQCGIVMTDEQIRHGWKIDSNDYTTVCGSCHNRFVPRFCVYAKDGSNPIFCEYLSPPVLQKELDTLLRDLQQHQGDYITSRTFQLRSPTVFWNLVWHLTNLALPINHLVPWMSTISPEKSAGRTSSSPRTTGVGRSPRRNRSAFNVGGAVALSSGNRCSSALPQIAVDSGPFKYALESTDLP
uniref:UDENN domain-containing protein n=1 Tax=Spongospora subterranea TaxID=70186 RepID=A0A0H5R8J7_9EUKA|eukprot:CRZ10042.1 hypothetical protein [Spongospora subterranea]